MRSIWVSVKVYPPANYPRGGFLDCWVPCEVSPARAQLWWTGIADNPSVLGPEVIHIPSYSEIRCVYIYTYIHILSAHVTFYFLFHVILHHPGFIKLPWAPIRANHPK